MKNPKPSTAFHAAAGAVLLGLGSLAFAQPAAPGAAAPTKEEAVALPQFTITEKPNGRYQSGQALSASRISSGDLAGLGFNAGLDYKGDVASENASDYTTTRPLPTGPAFVPVQPSFLIEGRTLVNVGVTHQRGQWSGGLTILNALNKEYILAAGSRGAVTVGTRATGKRRSAINFARGSGRLGWGILPPRSAHSIDRGPLRRAAFFSRYL